MATDGVVRYGEYSVRSNCGPGQDMARWRTPMEHLYVLQRYEHVFLNDFIWAVFWCLRNSNFSHSQNFHVNKFPKRQFSSMVLIFFPLLC